MTDGKTGSLPRRAALAGLGVAALPLLARAQAPAVRKKVTLSYWTWSDNPSHQKMLTDAVDQFNKSQGFVTVRLDAGSRPIEEASSRCANAGSAPCRSR